MGKIAKQIHESKIHIAEQAINKCSVISSTITNFYSNIDCFETEFIKYFLKTLSLLTDEDSKEEKLSVDEKNYCLNPIEKNLFSSVFNREIKSKISSINKFTLEKMVIATNKYSTITNEKNNNQFIKTKNNKYYIVVKILKIENHFFLLCNEFKNLNFLNVTENLFYHYIQWTTSKSTTYELIKSSDIECQVTVIRHFSKFFIFEIFNRHV